MTDFKPHVETLGRDNEMLLEAPRITATLEPMCFVMVC